MIHRILFLLFNDAEGDTTTESSWDSSMSVDFAISMFALGALVSWATIVIVKVCIEADTTRTTKPLNLEEYLHIAKIRKEDEDASPSQGVISLDYSMIMNLNGTMDSSTSDECNCNIEGKSCTVHSFIDSFRHLKSVVQSTHRSTYRDIDEGNIVIDTKFFTIISQIFPEYCLSLLYDDASLKNAQTNMPNYFNSYQRDSNVCNRLDTIKYDKTNICASSIPSVSVRSAGGEENQNKGPLYNSDGYSEPLYISDGYSGPLYNSDGYKEDVPNSDRYKEDVHISDRYKEDVPISDRYKEDVPISDRYKGEIYDTKGNVCNNGQYTADSKYGINGNGINDNGINDNGINSNGLNDNGLNDNGINDNGLNDNGINSNGINSNGINSNGINSNGINSNGINEDNTLVTELQAALLYIDQMDKVSVRDIRHFRTVCIYIIELWTDLVEQLDEFRSSLQFSIVEPELKVIEIQVQRLEGAVHRADEIIVEYERTKEAKRQAELNLKKNDCSMKHKAKKVLDSHIKNCKHCRHLLPKNTGNDYCNDVHKLMAKLGEDDHIVTARTSYVVNIAPDYPPKKKSKKYKKNTSKTKNMKYNQHY